MLSLTFDCQAGLGSELNQFGQFPDPKRRRGIGVT
jgi:hypothetical protein